MTSITCAGSATSRTSPLAGPDAHGPRALITAALVAGFLAFVVAALGIGVRAADVGTAAVDEPQYLLTAVSLAEDGNLDISDERAQGRDADFHDGVLPVQTSVLDGGRRVSPHDPLLPVLLAPAMSLAEVVGLPGWVGAKLLLAALAGILAGTTAWVLGTRWPVPPVWAGGVAAVAGMSAPLAVYGHQVYPELPAALAVVIAVAVIIPRRAQTVAPSMNESSIAARIVNRPMPQWSLGRVVVLILAVSALPWLSLKYAPVAAALAVVALLRIRRGSTRTAAITVAAFGVSGVAWIVAHHVLYGGWTAYATGDHFAAAGEFSVVGVTPDYLSRSTRLIGLLVDRDYGIAAWQPAWLMVLPALGLLAALGRRSSRNARAQGKVSQGSYSRGGDPLHLDVLLAPLAAGLLTATFAALTMHGFWSPGRQLVVVLPLAAMVIAIAGAHVLTHSSLPQRRLVIAAGVALGLAGVAIHAWTLTAGYAGTLTWVDAPNVTPPPPIELLRSVLPDYRVLGTSGWALHCGWVVVAVVLIALGFATGSRRYLIGDPQPGDSQHRGSRLFDARLNDPQTAKDGTSR